MNQFSKFIAPLSPQVFFTNYWTKRATVIQANQAEKFNPLFSWQTLNYLLNFHPLTYPAVRFTIDGKSIPNLDRNQGLNALQQGSTLVIDSIHQRVPAVAQFATQLQAELGHPVQVNCYCSPPEQQGFNCHYDTHEVFILQIAGDKQWFVFDETIPYPLSNTRSSEDCPPETPAYLQTTLTPGDILYIPRGHWHYAVAGQEPSLHLTLGIDCYVGVDFAEWLVNTLQNEVNWRENLPLQELGDSTPFLQGLSRLKNDLIERLQNTNFEQEYANYLLQLQRPIEPYSLPYQLGFEWCSQGWDSRYILPPFPPAQVESHSETEYTIKVGNKVAKLSGVSALLIENLLQGEVFTIADLADWLPDADWETEIEPVLKQLIQSGILFVAP